MYTYICMYICIYTFVFKQKQAEGRVEVATGAGKLASSVSIASA